MLPCKINVNKLNIISSLFVRLEIELTTTLYCAIMFHQVSPLTTNDYYNYDDDSRTLPFWVVKQGYNGFNNNNNNTIGIRITSWDRTPYI